LYIQEIVAVGAGGQKTVKIWETAIKQNREKIGLKKIK
jgi:hypothetical protein